MDTAEVIEQVKSIGGIEGVYEVHRFDGTRNGLGVTVELSDGGPNYPIQEARFACKVIQEDQKTAAGNPAQNPRNALLNVHWNELD